MLSSVDLPEPDEPTIATISPRSIANDDAVERRDAFVAHRVVAGDVYELDQGRHRRRERTPPSSARGSESRDQRASRRTTTRTACVIWRNVAPSILSIVSVG